MTHPVGGAICHRHRPASMRKGLIKSQRFGWIGDEAVAGAQFVKSGDRIQLRRSDFKFQINRQILQRQTGGPTVGNGVFFQNLVDMLKSLLPGSRQSIGQIMQIDSAARGPDCKDEWQPGEFPPSLAEIELMIKNRRLFADHFIPDQQLGIRLLIISLQMTRARATEV